MAQIRLGQPQVARPLTPHAHLALIELKEQVLAEAIEAVQHPAKVADALAGLVDRALQDVLVVCHRGPRQGAKTLRSRETGCGNGTCGGNVVFLFPGFSGA